MERKYFEKFLKDFFLVKEENFNSSLKIIFNELVKKINFYLENKAASPYFPHDLQKILLAFADLREFAF